MEYDAYVTIRDRGTLPMNPCGVAHFKNAPCRECERLSSGPTDKAKAREIVPDAGERSIEPRLAQSSRGRKRVVETPKARTYTAEKQRRYRERKKATDPNYLNREAMRQRERRKA